MSDHNFNSESTTPQPKFCAGKSVKNTLTNQAGATYHTITFEQIVEMSRNPPIMPKNDANWFLPSIYNKHDAREHKAQELNGVYHAICIDIDDGNYDLVSVNKAFDEVIGESERLVYSTKSATESNKRWRVIIPLASGANFASWSATYKHITAKIILNADESSKRAGQISFLPNRGEFYKHAYCGTPDELFKPLPAPPEPIAQPVQQLPLMASTPPASLPDWATGRSSPIDNFNAQNSVESLLVRYRYQSQDNTNRHWRSPIQTSTSFATEVVGNRWRSISESDKIAGIGNPSRDGHCVTGDAFDLYCFYEHDNNSAKAIDALRPKVVAPTQDIQSKIAVKIESAFAGILPAGAVIIDRTIIEKMVGSIYFNPDKRSFFLLAENSIIEAKADKVAPFAKDIFGDFMDTATFKRAVEAAAPLQQPALNAAQQTRFIKDQLAKPNLFFVDYIERHNQRSAVKLSVDMFATESNVALVPEFANVTLTHKDFVCDVPDMRRVNDFKEHFGQFDEFLVWLAACRFAADRKKSYVWFKATSNFGKSFITTIMQELGLVVEMSVREIEAAFEGKPSPRMPSDFVNSWILVIEEFKSVKSELKELQNGMTLNPKFKSTIKVNLYAKLFLSAEDVGSLAGEDLGAETQFANRFNLLDKSGTLSDRPIFNEHREAYKSAIRNYIAAFLNAQVAEYRALGQNVACHVADGRLDAFHAINGLEHKFGTIDSRIGELKANFIDYVVDIFKMSDFARNHEQREVAECTLEKSGELFIMRPKKLLELFIKYNFQQSEAGRLYPKLGAIVKDFGGANSVRIGTKIYQALYLTKL